MDTLSWKCIALLAIAMCAMTMAVPVPQDSLDEPLNPITAAVCIQVLLCFIKNIFLLFGYSSNKCNLLNSARQF